MLTYYTLTPHLCGLQLTVSYDTGWNASLNCGGKSQWTTIIPFRNEVAQVSIKLCNMPSSFSATLHKQTKILNIASSGIQVDRLDSSVMTTVSGPVSIKLGKV